jgi:hypothetical protein
MVLMTKKIETPAPFVGLHRDYEKSLQRVLFAAGVLHELLATLMELGQIPESVRPRVRKALNEYNEAWYGEP